MPEQGLDGGNGGNLWGYNIFLNSSKIMYSINLSYFSDFVFRLYDYIDVCLCVCVFV